MKVTFRYDGTPDWLTDLRQCAASAWASAACSLYLSLWKTLAHSLSVSQAAISLWTTLVLSVSPGSPLPLRARMHSTAPLEHETQN